MSTEVGEAIQRVVDLIDGLDDKTAFQVSLQLEDHLAGYFKARFIPEGEI